MLTGFGIETRFRKPESLDRTSSKDVRLDDLINIGFGDMSIPDGIRIHNNIRPMLALIEAAGLVGADSASEASHRQLLFERFLQLRFGHRIAASSRMACWTLVSADKNMFFKLRHQDSNPSSPYLT